MNTKKIIFAVLASATLLAATSCSPNTTADDDELYEQGIDRKKMVRRG